MDLTWLDPDDLDRRDLAGAVAVLEAARATDHLRLPGPTVSSFTARLRHGWDGNPPVAAVARYRDGRVRAVLTVSLPRWDNHHLAMVRVVVDHRGHRLGLLLKIDMLRWLREVEPQVRTVDTGNAVSNAHMIGVNQRLGYEVLARTVEWQRRL